MIRNFWRYTGSKIIVVVIFKNNDQLFNVSKFNPKMIFWTHFLHTILDRAFILNIKAKLSIIIQGVSAKNVILLLTRDMGTNIDCI